MDINQASAVYLLGIVQGLLIGLFTAWLVSQFAKK